MKLLFITTQFPYPADNGGKIGALNGISVVSRKCEVTVLSFTEEDDLIQEGLEYFKREFPNVVFLSPIRHDIHIRKKPLKLAKVMMQNYLKNIPYVAMKFKNKEMFEMIDQNFCEGQYWDLVFIDYLNMNIYADYIRGKYRSQFNKMIFKDHNLEYEIVKQESDSSSGLKKAILSFEWKRTLRYEVKAIAAADLTFSVCQSNREFLAQYNSCAWTMLPTYKISSVRRELSTENSIFYMGNLSWKPNMEGVSWFVEKVLPLIREQIPDATLTIVGSGPNEKLFCEVDGVNYRGYVKDISEIYSDMKVFIVPLFEGSGIRIKILEAFDNEIAVVSTSLGCKTIMAEHGRELFIADQEKEFADAVNRLLEDNEINRCMTKAAKSFLECNFSLQARQTEFENIIDHVIE